MVYVELGLRMSCSTSVFTILISSFSFLISACLAHANESVVEDIVSGGGWQMVSSAPGRPDFHAAVIFKNENKIRFRYQGLNVGGNYRILGTTICFKAPRAWGRSERCETAQEKNGTYYLGNWQLSK